MIKEFKEFISKGNVMDLAVGVIIGGAFGKIVSSLVNDLIMPLIGLISGNVDFKSLSYGKIMYGNFIQTLLDFFIIAICIFLIIKVLNKFKKKKEQKPAEPIVPEPSKEELLLTEIRDLLKERK